VFPVENWLPSVNVPVKEEKSNRISAETLQVSAEIKVTGRRVMAANMIAVILEAKQTMYLSV
jgi:hypothetical protein